MYENRRVVVVTPAGRARYMQLLEPNVFRSELVDRWDIWLNTSQPEDIKWIRALQRRRPDKVNIVLVSGMEQDIIRNIAKFWRLATDENTIYIRFDDDVVWIHPDTVESLCRARLDHPECWMISGNVINNAICDHHLQRAGLYDDRYRFTDSVSCSQGWASPEAAEWKHRCFLEDLSQGKANRWRIQDYRIELGKHFSINCLCWAGGDLAGLNFFDEEGFISYEEPFLTKEMTVRTGRPMMVAGQALLAHFAFYPQRDDLDSTDLLDCYRRFAS